MKLITNIVLGLVKLALAVGLAGGLVDATISMRDHALQAHRQGLVSLKALNESLMRH